MSNTLLDYNQPLTEAERQFAEEWHGLMYKVLHRKIPLTTVRLSLTVKIQKQIFYGVLYTIKLSLSRLK